MQKPTDTMTVPATDGLTPATTTRSSRILGIYASVFRIVVGVTFAIHGAAGLFGVFGGRGGTGATIAFGTWPSWYAALIQLIAGGLVALGLFTRPAALLCSGSMAYAYFTVHIEKSLWPVQNGGEAAALFCWAFLTIAFLGAGTWSLDAALSRRPART